MTVFLSLKPNVLIFLKKAKFCLPPQASVSSQQGSNSQTFSWQKILDSGGQVQAPSFSFCPLLFSRRLPFC